LSAEEFARRYGPRTEREPSGGHGAPARSAAPVWRGRLALICLLLVAGAPGIGRSQEPSIFYPARFYPDSPDLAGAAIIALQPGDSSLPLILTCRPSGGSVSVRVLSAEGGGPIEGILVEACVGRFRSSAKTGGDGRAVIPGVPAGLARIRARPDDPRSETGAYAIRYAPGGVDSADALSYRVADGATTDAGDLTLPAAGRIKATVRRPSGDPWPQVPLILRSVDGTKRLARPADDEGRVTFGGLESGSYRLWVDARGTEAISESWDGSRDTSNAAPIAVAAGELIAGITIAPDFGGVIRGDVRHRDSNLGIANVEVRAYPPGVPSQAYTTRTEDLGFYALRGLPSGSYIVHVPAIRRYYPDAESESGARRVAVREGAETGGIDLKGKLDADCLLPPSLEGVIEGVLQADFGRLPSARIVATGSPGVFSVTIKAGMSTIWRIGCLPSGSYTVAFVPDGVYRTQYHPRTYDPAQALPVDVVAGDTTRSVSFLPDLGVVLRGSVVSQGSEALRDIPIVAIEQSMSLRATAETDDVGDFRIDRLADGTGLPAGNWIVSTDSLTVNNTAVSPALWIDLVAEVEGRGVRLRFAFPPGVPVASWRLERRLAGGEPSTVADAGSHPDGAGALDFLDPIDAGGVSYRLTAHLRADGILAEYRTDWVSPMPSPGTPRCIFPQPWNGVGDLVLPDGAALESVVDFFGADGALKLRLSPREGRIALSGQGDLSSGVYFLRWKDARGRERAGRVVLQR